MVTVGRFPRLCSLLYTQDTLTQNLHREGKAKHGSVKERMRLTQDPVTSSPPPFQPCREESLVLCSSHHSSTSRCPRFTSLLLSLLLVQLYPH